MDFCKLLVLVLNNSPSNIFSVPAHASELVDSNTHFKGTRDSVFSLVYGIS